MRTIVLMLCRITVACLLTLPVTLTARATVEDEIARDFKPLDGYVVMREGAEFIIDLDAGHGIRPGDIFAVAGPGKDIVHPVTQKVLGKIETVKGILKVTRTAEGYSFARAIDESAAIERGDPIRRYALLPAIFWDYSGSGEPMYAKLRQLLPRLKWREYGKAQQQRPAQPGPAAATANALAFVYAQNELVVRDPEFNELRRYPLGAAAVPAEPEAKAPPAPSRAPSTAKAPVIAPEFKQVQTVAELPKTALMADFLFTGNDLMLASTDGESIDIFKLTDGLKPVGSAAPPTTARVLALKWWVPGATAVPHLAVTTWQDDTVVGMIFRLDAGRLSPLPVKISRILGAFDLDGNGLPETLFGQDFDGETFFGQRIKRLTLVGDDIRSVSLDMKLPRRFPVLGSLLADLTGDGQLENAFIRDSILYIYSGKKRLYKSVKKMGGTLSFLTYEVDPSFQDPKPATAAFEISPVAADLNADGRNELLALASDRSLLGSLRITPGLTKTWVRVLKYDNGRFTGGTLGEEFETALQGISFNQQRLMMVATEFGDLSAQGHKSHLLAYSLVPQAEK